ncbi:MAG TPA: hypothetical protein VFQ00_03535 [Terriglobales bacterium]|nr:hypothetical protein [Terriglobales bacterium]
MAIDDTSAEFRERQWEIQQAMTGEQRLLLALEISEMGRELARAGIRQDHPEWSEAQVKRELIRLAFLPHPLPVGF